MGSFVNFVKSLSIETIFQMFASGVFRAEKLHSKVLDVVNDKIVFEKAEVDVTQYDKLCEVASEESGVGDIEYSLDMPSTSHVDCKASNSNFTHIKNLPVETIFEMFASGVFRAEKLHSKVLDVVNDKIVFEKAQVDVTLYDKLCEVASKESSACDIEYSLDMPSTSHADCNVSNNNRNVEQPSTPHTGNGGVSVEELTDNQQQQQTAELAEDRYIKVVRETSKYNKKFSIMSKIVQFRVDNEEAGNNPHEWLENVVKELLKKTLDGCDPSDYIGIRIDNAEVPERPIGISLRKASQYSAEVVLVVVASVMQSNEKFFTKDLLTMDVTRISLPRGGGGMYVNLVGSPSDDFCIIKHRSFIRTPHANDNMCLARALILAITFKTKPIAELNSLINENVLLTNQARSLCGNVGIDRNTICNYEHIQLFQNYLQNFTIRVYNSRDGSTTTFEGPRSDERIILNLYLENNHYNVIKSLTGAFSIQYFCEYCKKGYSRNDRHRSCPYKCPCCLSVPQCKTPIDSITCDVCKRDFRGIDCFNKHQDKICSQLQRCLNCFKSVLKGEKHKCGYKYCLTCSSEKPIRHQCFMTVKNPVQKIKKFVYIFFDLESTQDKQDDRGHFEHKPNLCVAQNVCNHCLDDDDISRGCRFCGKRLHIFKENPVREFLEYVSSSFRKHKVFAFAHNMKGYDGTFILREIMNDTKAWNPKIISNGTKLMSITCGNIKFLDSLNFIPLPLSKLPSTFGFDGLKGYFPYLFNTSDNQNYVGPLPETELYAPENMSVSERSAFLDWYQEMINQNFIFNMSIEIEKYCLSDVNILRKACLKFRQTFIASTDLDPFLKTVTIAGACNLVFRRSFLQENTIGIIPLEGYRMSDKQSVLALKWLLHMQRVLNTRIQHTGVDLEVRLPEGILVDGYIASTKTVLEYNGCYWHGCRKCYKHHTVDSSFSINRKKLKQKDQMFQRYEATIAKQRRIQSLGYNLLSTWECEFNEFVNDNQDVKLFLDQQFDQYKDPLNPRDAFYGGRTEAVKLNCSINQIENEEIHYYDVCSLYPYVNKYKKCPVGHPKIYIGEDCSNIDLNTVEGLVKCSVLPPQNLYHPVLPYRSNGKLMFPLCRTCVENLQQTDCQHTCEQRSFTGTFVVDELRKAMELNYTVLIIFEVWEYKVTQFNPVTNEGGLFSGYVNKFLKLKQENSGWPLNCTTEQSKMKYIGEYFEREGIKLDFDNISKNSGFRYLAKLMLNSFWGKFGQRENLPQTSIIFNPEELFRIITDPSVNTKSVLFISDECIVLNWESIKEAINPLRTVNVAIAAYTTANARLVLYDYLEKLGERVIYMDTDSIVTTKKPGEWMPESGDFLGMMTNELETYGRNAYITDFISTGPKSYSFKVFSPEKNKTEIVCKVEGITLNYKNSLLINFDSMRELVLGSLDRISTFNDRKIVRRIDYQVVSKPESKMYTVQFNKRRRLSDSFDSYPYGFKF